MTAGPLASGGFNSVFGRAGGPPAFGPLAGISLSWAGPAVVARGCPRPKPIAPVAAARIIPTSSFLMAARGRPVREGGDAWRGLAGDRRADRGYQSGWYCCRPRGRHQDQQPGAQRHAAAGEGVVQPLPAAFELPLERGRRDPELRRGLVAGQPLDTAEDYRGPIPFRELAEFVVEDRQKLLARDVGEGIGRRLGRRPALVLNPPGPGRAGVEGHLPGGGVEPTRHGRPPAGRTRLPGQDQERRLAGVVGVGRVAEDPAADAADHRPVPLDQGGEGGLVLVAGESPEQVAIGNRLAAGGGAWRNSGNRAAGRVAIGDLRRVRFNLHPEICHRGRSATPIPSLRS